MIVDALVDFVVWVLTPITGALPQMGLPWDTTALDAAWSHLFDLNYFLPIAEVTGAVFAAYALGPAALASSIVLWIVVGVFRGGQASV